MWPPKILLGFEDETYNLLDPYLKKIFKQRQPQIFLQRNSSFVNICLPAKFHHNISKKPWMMEECKKITMRYAPPKFSVQAIYF
jgi:hypothetical protein